MPTPLLEFADRLIAGLNRRAVRSPSQWAEAYRRTKQGKAWSLRRYPWTKEMLDCSASRCCAKKGAQLAVTETLLTLGMHANDVLKRDVLYVLPNKTPDASDFSSARFDAAVLASPYLSQLYDRSNVGHKRTGVANFYIRGGQSRAGLKSVPVYLLILDELDEMNQENVPLAYERTSGQDEKIIWEVSTPTIDDHGIDRSWNESSQETFCFPCPHCSRWIDLTHDNLIVVGDDPTSTRTLSESHVVCALCKHPLDHAAKMEWLAKGRWVPGIEGRASRGFYVNQLYSTTVHPGEVAAAWLRGQLNAVDEQEYWNSKMGMPHTPKGAKLVDAQIRACCGEHADGSPAAGRITTMGVDVGKFLHYEIDEWTLGDGTDINESSVPRVLKCGKVRSFDELDAFMLDYRVTYAVVDAHPERRAAFNFANRFWGHVGMCIYGNGVSGKLINQHKSEFGEPLVTVDRSSWLDQSIGARFAQRKIVLPRDVPFEYVEHVSAIARIWRRGSDGNPVAEWVTPGRKADHHAHARNYAEIALALSTGASQAQDVESPL